VRRALILLTFLLPVTAYAGPSSPQVEAQYVRCRQLRLDRSPELHACAEELERMGPDSIEANVLRSEIAVDEERFEDAARLLDHAHALGLEDNVYEARRGRVDEWIGIKGGTPPARPSAHTGAYKAGQLAAMIFVGVFAVIALWGLVRRKPRTGGR
jgi:hypothetical protein